MDLYRDPILWSNVSRGIALQAVYVGVLLLARLGELHDPRRHELSRPQSPGAQVGIGPVPSASRTIA